MPYILNIETATRNCSVSLAKDGTTVICEEIAGQGYSHAEKLHVFIQQVLKEAHVPFSQLDAVAVSKGPGSYTGLRIGVSAAKGLCYAIGIPLIAVDTLAILARQLEVQGGLIVPMIDARRMEVYSAVFDPKGEKVRKVRAEILTEESFSEYPQTVHFLGDSNEKARTVLTRGNFVFHDGMAFPSAKEMGALSHEKFLKNDFEDVAYFEPYYLKDFLATAKKTTSDSP